MAYATYRRRVEALPPAYSGLRQSAPINPNVQQQDRETNGCPPCKCEEKSCFWWALGGAALGILTGAVIFS